MSIKIETILLPKEATLDSTVSLAILYKYCSKKLTGLSKAKLEFRASLPSGKSMDYFLNKGILPLMSLMENILVLEQIANYKAFSLSKYPIVNQLISILKDEDYLSEDRGLILSWRYLVDILKKDHQKFLLLVLPILKEYLNFLEEKRVEFLEYCQSAVKKGKLTSFSVSQQRKKLKVVFISFDADDIAEYLFYKPEVLADIVVIFKSKGEIFIKTRPDQDIDLLDVVAILRVETARHKKIPFDQINKHVLNRSGVMEGIGYWNFEADRSRIRSIKNTALDKLTIKKALIIGLDLDKMAKGECPPQSGCKGKKCSYYSYNMLRCRKRRAGVKDNYLVDSDQEKKSNYRKNKKRNIRVYRK